MKDRRRIFALIGVFLLLALYIISFITALSSSPSSTGWFMTSIFCTVFIPIFLYLAQWARKHYRKNRSSIEEEDLQDETDLEDINALNNNEELSDIPLESTSVESVPDESEDPEALNNEEESNDSSDLEPEELESINNTEDLEDADSLEHNSDETAELPLQSIPDESEDPEALNSEEEE